MVWAYVSIGQEAGKLRVLPQKTLAPPLPKALTHYPLLPFEVATLQTNWVANKAATFMR